MWRRPGYLAKQSVLSLSAFCNLSKPGICLVKEGAAYEGWDPGASLVDCVLEASQWKVWIVRVGGFLYEPATVVRHEDNHRVLVLTSLHQSLGYLDKQIKLFLLI